MLRLLSDLGRRELERASRVPCPLAPLGDAWILAMFLAQKGRRDLACDLLAHTVMGRERAERTMRLLCPTTE